MPFVASMAVLPDSFFLLVLSMFVGAALALLVLAFGVLLWVEDRRRRLFDAELDRFWAEYGSLRAGWRWPKTKEAARGVVD